jgi:hypothetical protein
VTVILILEDDADREAWQRGPAHIFARIVNHPSTVWISPEAYAQDVVLPMVAAPLRISVQDLQHEPAAIDLVKEAAHEAVHLAQDPPT